MDAKKEVIGPDEVWAFLQSGETIHVASGQKILSFKPDKTNKEQLLNKATGRTGNLRAPALRIGKNLYIGFNTSMYGDLRG